MARTMLAVVKDKKAPGVSIKKVTIPKPQKDEILVKVIHASICGTDVGIYDWIPWAQNHIKPPRIIGHEMVGEVIEINSSKKTKIKKGDLVSSETHIFCLNCYQCEIKNYHICENMELFGIGRNGGFAEFATIPIRTTWKNNPSVPLEAMSVQESLGNAVNVVTKAEVKNKKVLVMGLGPTGLCAGMVAKAYGAKEVVGVNRREYRRKLAKSVGFDRVIEKIDPGEYSTFDAVLEMSGNRMGIQIALDSVRIGGKIVAFGIPKEDITFDWGKYLINKELSISSVFGRMIWDTWHDTTKLLVSKKVDLQKIITHRFKLSEFEKAMEVMKSGECGKIVLTP
ncbi:MAG: L-threonine 3-dehydrogenase [Candidatus Levybacteria bacterium CG10_big_fil_rev_8_21_14_0_10_35_13]|nr:MAG: L-threonine 3-dehydrogenase [Candidatus Levybacteria bacterium CG10_big_fil_rev_8_21_14_0_10_35_13]